LEGTKPARPEKKQRAAGQGKKDQGKGEGKAKRFPKGTGRCIRGGERGGREGETTIMGGEERK